MSALDDLFEGCASGNLSQVKQALRDGADINESLDEYGYGSTALHVATVYAFGEIVNYLLSQGADAFIENSEGKTPLDFVTTEALNKIFLRYTSYDSTEDDEPTYQKPKAKAPVKPSPVPKAKTKPSSASRPKKKIEPVYEETDYSVLDTEDEMNRTPAPSAQSTRDQDLVNETQPAIQLCQQELRAAYAKLESQPALADLRVMVKNQEFYLHTPIFAARAPKFLIEQNRKEGLGIVSSEAFSEFVRFVYSDRCKLDSHDAKSLFDILELALSFELDVLQVQCENHLIDRLMAVNEAISITEIAMTRNHSDLYDWGVWVLVKNHPNLPEDKLEALPSKLLLRVMKEQKKPTLSQPVRKPVPPSQYIDQFSMLCKSGEHSDVDIVVSHPTDATKDMKIPAHKALLAVRSKYFAEVFSAEGDAEATPATTEEDDAVVEDNEDGSEDESESKKKKKKNKKKQQNHKKSLANNRGPMLNSHKPETQMPFGTYYQMINFLYCAELNFDSSECLVLLAEADKYGIKSEALIDYCSAITLGDVSVKNCIAFFEQSSKLELEPVREKAMGLIVANFATIKSQIRKMDKDLQIEVLMETTAALCNKLYR